MSDKYCSPYLKNFTQGGMGTCVAVAASSCLEIMEMNRLKTENVPELSRMYLYAKCKSRDGVKEHGTYPSTACSVIKNEGICLESLYPYVTDNDAYNLKFPPFTTEMNNDAKTRRVKSYTTSKNLDIIKNHIKKYGACMMEEYYHHTKYDKNVLVDIGKQSTGRHLTCLIGWDNNFEYKGFKGAFLRLNGDNPELGYSGGIEIIPYVFLSHKWFINAYLMTPMETSTYLQDKYTGVGITLPTDVIKMTIGNKVATLNGESVELKTEPVIINGTTMVHLRTVDLFRKCDVLWNNVSKTAEVQHQLGSLYFKIGSKEITNGYGEVVCESLVGTQLIGGYTMIPLRALAECLGCKVNYDSKKKEITIVR